MLERFRKLDQSLVGRIQFRSSNKVSLEAECAILDRFKNDLLSTNVDKEVKGKFYYFLQRYLREVQKDRCPGIKGPSGRAHYVSEDAFEKKNKDDEAHLEHPIPQNKILQAYIEDHITALEAINMPLCYIAGADKHILEGEWQYNATWEFPFKRYQLAGFTKQIKNLRGEPIDPNTWTIEDHFQMLGINNSIKDNTIQA
jgi:hypothetical protein